MVSTFLYFAYGSNLLKKRLHQNNPTASLVCYGRLDNHRLDFIRESKRWGGAVATIVPTANAHVWGALWSIDKTDLQSLDQQEGVDTGCYFAKSVIIYTPWNGSHKCRVYQQVDNPVPRGDNDLVAENCRPSKTYIEVIIKGAEECELPDYYVEMLKKINHNGKHASQEMEDLLY